MVNLSFALWYFYAIDSAPQLENIWTRLLCSSDVRFYCIINLGLQQTNKQIIFAINQSTDY